MIGSNWRARNARIASALTPARRASTLRGDFEQPRFEFADRVNRGPAERRTCDERPQCFEVGDKATGASEITASMAGNRSITYNEAVAKYFLADYVRNREGWIPQARKEFFEGVLAMSSRDEQARWTAFYAHDNPKSPQSIFTDLDTVFIAIKSVTFVSKNVAQIRFTKTLQHGAVTTDTPAIATVTYDTTDTPTTEQQRFKNPLGLEVQTYRADLEVTQ